MPVYEWISISAYDGVEIPVDEIIAAMHGIVAKTVYTITIVVHAGVPYHLVRHPPTESMLEVTQGQEVYLPQQSQVHLC